MNNLVKLPCEHEAFYLARRVLRSPDPTPEQITAALGVLQHSPDWMDQELCRQMRPQTKAQKLIHGFPVKSQADIDAEITAELEAFIGWFLRTAAAIVAGVAIAAGIAYALMPLVQP